VDGEHRKSWAQFHMQKQQGMAWLDWWLDHLCAAPMITLEKVWFDQCLDVWDFVDFEVMKAADKELGFPVREEVAVKN
jgi:hypothetical protein